MIQPAFLGLDVGTGSTKGVLVADDGTVLRTAHRTHRVSRPQPGHVEMDAAVWWQELCDLTGELTKPGDAEIVAVGVSGMGPCVLVVDENDQPLRPAILYGVDTRSRKQITSLTTELGQQDILRRCGSVLSTQAVGPKLAWLAEHEAATFDRARRLFMPSSWLGYRLTGEYGLDYHSASQCVPMFDRNQMGWYPPWADRLRGRIELPPLSWPGEVLGTVTAGAASRTGLRVGTPVITGTIDAWSEAVSVGADRVGELMIMYGSTMFLVHTLAQPAATPSLWGTVGVTAGTHSLAGGLATSGAITAWLGELFGDVGYDRLLAEAERSGPGARGVLMLPYFAGERTPIMDPDARGIVAGLTLDHTRADVYRAALEATAMAVRHNLETMTAAGAAIDRVVAVGGGAQSDLWTQIVSDVSGLPQVIPSQTIGASLGSAVLAARTQTDVAIDEWNPPAGVREPDPALAGDYADLYHLFRNLYESTRSTAHTLAERQRRLARSAKER